MKEQIIQIPDTLEVKEIKNGKIILVEKEKKLTYEDVAKIIFPYEAYHYYIQADGYICKIKNSPSNYKLSDNALSKRQLEKLLAINKLMNVAKYLNDGWHPDWCNTGSCKYFIRLKSNDDMYIDLITTARDNSIYFKSEELAEKAIEILGEDTIRLALCTDY